MPPYRGCVESGVTGLLADPSTDAWLSAILFLANRPDERRRIAAQSETDVRNRYSVVSVARTWEQCIRETRDTLRIRPSHLLRAYLRGFILSELSRDIRTLWLQVQDAYGKGGVRMVISKTGQRFSRTVIKVLGLRSNRR